MLKRPRGRPKKDDLIAGLDWDLLRYFYLIAVHGGYAEAGRKIDKAQAYLSQRIQSLEHALGYEVFIRGAHGVDLTRKGEELFQFAEKLYFDLKGRVRPEVIVEGQRLIRIVATHSMMSYVLLTPLIEFQRQHPNILLDLVGDDADLNLTRHDADILIAPGVSAPEEGVTRVRLFSMSKRLYASQSYLQQFGEPRSVEDLKNHKIISSIHRNLSPYSDILWALKLAYGDEFRRRPDYISNTLECVVYYAEAGLGIAGVYPAMDIVQKSTLVNVLPQIESVPLDFHLSYAGSLSDDLEAQSLIHHLQKSFE